MGQITIDGHAMPLRASMRAWQKWEEATGQKMQAFNTASSPTEMVTLAYFFAEAGMKRDGKAMDLELEEFMDLVEMDDLETIGLAVAQTIMRQKKAPAKKVGSR